MDEQDDDRQRYDPNPFINDLRVEVDRWRELPRSSWNVTPETARLLDHWRNHEFNNQRPFFCQVEAVESLIWLTEVAPHLAAGRKFLDRIRDANHDANPELTRIALKLATGAGKTTVMAMIIAWQTINAARRPGSKSFTRGFLVVTPGITIKDRLRILKPEHPDSYYRSRELVPQDMLQDVMKAKVVITNYHAFKRRDQFEGAAGTRALAQGRHGAPLDTLETDGKVIQRAMGDLMGMKNILVLNDEAHHCYRQRPPEEDDEPDITAEEREEVKANNESARLWISGLEMVKRKLGLLNVIDLSATPFFLRGSGYREGTLFPWTMTDFSLMDAIECGIVKLPRVPVAENIDNSSDMPKFRDLWQNIRAKMPKMGRGRAQSLDPEELPTLLKTALDALYGHYEKIFRQWESDGIRVPPCFIIVCQNTAISKLVFDYVAGYVRTGPDGEATRNGQFELFQNYDSNGNPHSRPRTFLIDSEQLEAGEELSPEFKKIAAGEIERFRRQRIERGEARADDKIPEEALLREVMNTVGKVGELGESIRCVVSVSMLTEGWDTNSVTHVLGVRAFGTQLLCEQVIGRALRRQSYEMNEDGLFNVEYADVLGIPFDFNAKPVVVKPTKARETIQVKAMRPDRDALEIRFPRVRGYRVELPADRLTAKWTDGSHFELSPELVGPTITRNAGIIGEGVDLNLVHTGDMRFSTILMHLTKGLLETRWRDDDGNPRYNLYPQLRSVARDWLENYLHCVGNTYPAQLLYDEFLDTACEKITAAIVEGEKDRGQLVRIAVDPYNPEGSTMHVNFTTSQTDRYETDARKCHVNWVILDSGWEAELCRVVESHPRVLAYVKNHNLGFEVPYHFLGEPRTYIPDYIVLVDDGHGADDPLHLVVEVKGYRKQDAVVKKQTMETYWVPGVNAAKKYGRWAFVEFTSRYTMQSEFEARIEEELGALLEGVAHGR